MSLREYTSASSGGHSSPANYNEWIARDFPEDLLVDSYEQPLTLTRELLVNSQFGWPEQTLNQALEAALLLCTWGFKSQPLFCEGWDESLPLVAAEEERLFRSFGDGVASSLGCSLQRGSEPLDEKQVCQAATR